MAEAAAKLETQSVMVLAGGLLTEADLRRIVGEVVRAELGNTNGTGEPEGLLKIGVVARLLGVTTKSVQKYVTQKGLPASKAGAHYRFRREDVIAWLEEQAVKPGGHVSKTLERLNKLR
jgi:excisionase family DNA binding protein